MQQMDAMVFVAFIMYKLNHIIYEIKKNYTYIIFGYGESLL